MLLNPNMLYILLSLFYIFIRCSMGDVRDKRSMLNFNWTCHFVTAGVTVEELLWAIYGIDVVITL